MKTTKTQNFKASMPVDFYNLTGRRGIIDMLQGV